MSIYMLKTDEGEYAFVEFGAGYMLYIGTKADVKDATDEEIRKMIQEAVAYGRFHGIGESKGHAVN